MLYMTDNKYDKLTVDFSKHYSNSNKNKIKLEMASLPLGIGRQIIPWKSPNYRSPWKTIPEGHHKGMNFTFNLNMDTNIDDYENTKKWQIPRVLLFLEKLKADHIIYKYTIVYEWGKYGKKDGKLHYHGIVKTKQREEFVTLMCKEYNKNTNAKHRTITTKHLKDLDHRATYLKYIKKESQNKLKCLMWN